MHACSCNTIIMQEDYHIIDAGFDVYVFVLYNVYTQLAGDI